MKLYQKHLEIDKPYSLLLYARHKRGSVYYVRMCFSVSVSVFLETSSAYFNERSKKCRYAFAHGIPYFPSVSHAEARISLVRLDIV